ncbi:MAG: AraC family transcriptional regulator [Pseudomonadota bacterium]
MTPTAPTLHAERVRCGLQPRILGGLVRFRTRAWRVLLLQAGTAEILEDGEVLSLGAPALLWQPWEPGMRLRVLPGTVGAHLQLDDRVQSHAIGHSPEAADLRLLARARTLLDLRDRPTLLAEATAAFDSILREWQGAARGAETVIEAQLRILLVLLWRHAARQAAPRDQAAAATQILQRFRQLLEIHVRDRWGVGDYARALGITPDRLHDIATRSVGKPPLRLVHERTAWEAEQLLARTSQTVDQIAAHLGFRSAAQFSRFFRAMAGAPPGAYRRLLSAERESRGGRRSTAFADWP